MQVKTALPSFIHFVLFGAMYFALPAFSALKEIDKQELLARPSPFTSQATHKKLLRANDQLQNGNVSGAIEILQKLADHTSDRPFEKAQALHNLAFAYAQNNQLRQALSSFEKALEQKALPAGPTLISIFTMAQLQHSLDQSQAALETLEQWMRLAPKVGAEEQAFRGIILAKLGRKKEALKDLEAAISASDSPKDLWRELASVFYYENKNYSAAAVQLKILLDRNPDKQSYWQQLSAMYLLADDHKAALAVLEVAHKLGHLKEEKEIINLVHLYLLRNIPLKAAQLLEEKLKATKISASQKNYLLLSQAWLQSESPDKALEPLEKAAKLSQEGSTYAQLGNLLLDMELWEKAEQSFRQAERKGKVKNPGNLQLALGIVHFHQDELKQSREAFNQALKHKNSEKAARQWLAQLGP